MKTIPKGYRILKSNNKVRAGDYITTNSNFSDPWLAGVMHRLTAWSSMNDSFWQDWQGHKAGEHSEFTFIRKTTKQ